jgi:hypothetical protein
LGLDPVSRVKFPGHKVILEDGVVGRGNCIVDNLFAGRGFAPFVLVAVRDIVADFMFRVILLFDPN